MEQEDEYVKNKEYMESLNRQAQERLAANRQKVGTYVYSPDFKGFSDMPPPTNTQLLWPVGMFIFVMMVIVCVLGVGYFYV